MESISISRKEAHDFDMKEMHFHNYYEIYYLLAGKRFFFIKDKTYALEKGCLVLINHKIIHKTTSRETGYFDRLVVQIPRNHINPWNKEGLFNIQECFNRDSPVMKLPEESQEKLTARLFRLLEEYQGQASGRETLLPLLVTELLIYINRLQQADWQNENRHPINSRVFSVIDYINKNYMYPVNLKKLGQNACYSEFHLCKIFKEETGFTLIEYLNNVRIREAMNLLDREEKNITDTAFSVGFNSLNHFSRMFRQKTGMTPGQYRKNTGN